MAYIVLARKWRPKIFEDVVGQEHITQILINALKNQRIAHAYIFAGPRGVGKTSTARLLAKAVNCEKHPAINPCNECHTCKSITEGHSLDVIEIDGASNRGIDEIRNLRENIRFSPAAARYKIYIIDEVHMLTKEAFNALLKTLEEPPSHAIFIFATTEIHKVPLTILSRCQRFDFKRISVTRIQEMLQKITKAEKIKIDEEALLLIARKADGSMRDAESILDQMVSFSSEELTGNLVRDSLGLIDQEIFFEFTEMLTHPETAGILEYCKKVFSSGHDIIDFLHGLQEHLRNIMLTLSLKDTKLLEVSDFLKERYEKTVSEFDEKDIIHYLHILGDSEQKLKYSFFPELTLELILLKIAFKPSSVKIEELLGHFAKIPSVPPTGGSENSSDPSLTPRSSQEKNVQSKGNNPNTLKVTAKNEIRNQDTEPKNKNGFQNLESSLKNYQQFTEIVPTKEPKNIIDFSLDIGDIKSKWSDIVSKVRSDKIALASFLEEGIPYATEHNRLIIAYDNSSTFHLEHVEKNRKIIEGILKQDFQLPVNIQFKLIDFKGEGIEKEPRTPEEVIEDIKNKEPIIRKIIDVFGLDETLNSQ
ncbi:MAG: DNA polymerase III subunit gamma/tau [bacterium]|nr:MAG: DNA polymerase III subunit gamma/tau [bacterium]